MIDSTNPRILADNIRALSEASGSQASDISMLQASVEALGSYSTTEVDTGMVDADGNHIFRKIFKVDALPNNKTLNIPHGIDNLGDVYLLVGVAQKDGTTGYPLNYKGSILLSYTSDNVSVKTDSDFSSHGAILTFEYTKSASPSPVLLPAPDDTRSIEPEDRDTDSETEPIEEPVVEVKKTTRKKTTTTE